MTCIKIKNSTFKIVRIRLYIQSTVPLFLNLRFYTNACLLLVLGRVDRNSSRNSVGDIGDDIDLRNINSSFHKINNDILTLSQRDTFGTDQTIKTQ